MGHLLRMLSLCGLSRWVGWASFEATMTAWAATNTVLMKSVIAGFVGSILGTGASSVITGEAQAYSKEMRNQLGMIVGETAPESFSKKDLLAWSGKLAVAQLNNRFRTNFSTVYPPDVFISEFKAEFLTQLTNGGGSLIPHSAALDFANEMGRKYNFANGVAQKGANYKARDTKELRLNRARQKKFRLSHSRFHVWNSPETFDLIASAKAKLLLIRAEQKAARERKAVATRKRIYEMHRIGGLARHSPVVPPHSG